MTLSCLTNAKPEARRNLIYRNWLLVHAFGYWTVTIEYETTKQSTSKQVYVHKLLLITNLILINDFFKLCVKNGDRLIDMCLTYPFVNRWFKDHLCNRHSFSVSLDYNCNWKPQPIYRRDKDITMTSWRDAE